MEPLNKKERTGFIFKFSAVFIIAILVVLIPFYFTLRLPDYQNAILTQDVQKMQELVKIQKEVFAVQVDSVKRMVHRYSLANQDIEKLSDQMASHLNKMEEPYINDTSWNSRMYKNIIDLFFELKNAKKDQVRSETELKECKQDLEKAKEEAKKSKDTM